MDTHIYARMWNINVLLHNHQCITDAVDCNVVSQYHFDNMSKKDLYHKYDIGTNGCELTLPEGMRFECHNDIVYLVDKYNEIIYDMDYRKLDYNMKSPRVLAPYQYKLNDGM